MHRLIVDRHENHVIFQELPPYSGNLHVLTCMIAHAFMLWLGNICSIVTVRVPSGNFCTIFCSCRLLKCRWAMVAYAEHLMTDALSLPARCIVQGRLLLCHAGPPFKGELWNGTGSFFLPRRAHTDEPMKARRGIFNYHINVGDDGKFGENLNKEAVWAIGRNIVFSRDFPGFF